MIRGVERPLTDACEGGDVAQVVQLLAEGASVNETNVSVACRE